jgi:uncharacterized protein YndB with AHSA1/START domain
MEAQGSIDIAAPPEKVWPFLVEPDLILKWYTLLSDFRYTGEQHAGVGATFHFDEKAAGLMKLDFVVTEWVENEILAFHMTSGNFDKGYEQRWTLEPTAGGCRFTLAEDIKMPYGPVGRLLGLMASPSSKAHIEELLDQLKVLAEA